MKKLVKSIYTIVKLCTAKISRDNIATFSAGSSFFILISFFPFFMFLLTLIQFLPFTQTDIITTLTSLFPDFINSFITSLVNEIYTKTTGTIISLTVITALWSASRGFLAVVRGLNSAYGIKETRNYIIVRIISTLYTLVFAIIIILTLALLVFGNQIYLWINTKFPLLNDFALIVISFRTLVSLCVLTIFFLLLYRVIPNRKTHIFSELPGALLAASGWMLFSYLYSFYIDRLSDYSSMYGSLTAIVLLMLWLYFCMYILFMGAEVNMYLSSHKHPIKRLFSLI